MYRLKYDTVEIALRGNAKGTAGIPIAASQQFKRQVDDDGDEDDEDGKDGDDHDYDDHHGYDNTNDDLPNLERFHFALKRTYIR